MSAGKEKRTLEQVHGEYGQICAQLGHLEYQVRTLSKESELLMERLRDLNLEASSLPKAEKVEEKVKENG